MTDSDRAYYRRRLAEEDARAAQATCPASRAAHDRLAALYREKLCHGGVESLRGPRTAHPRHNASGVRLAESDETSQRVAARSCQTDHPVAQALEISDRKTRFGMRTGPL